MTEQLHLDSEAGILKQVRALIDVGCDVNARNTRCLDMTPLHHAARGGRDVVATMLIDGGADVDAADRNGQTPLFYTTYRGTRLAVAAVLLDRGANPRHADVNGHTALHLAASVGHAPVVSLLLEKGAVADATDGGGWKPLDLALEAGHAEVAELIRNPPPVHPEVERALRVRESMPALSSAVHEWTPAQAAAWVASLGEPYGPAAARFEAAGVDGEALLQLDHEVLETDLGVAGRKSRAFILAEAARRNAGTATP